MIKKSTEPDLALPHPGEILREEVLPRMALAEIELARRLELPPDRLADLLAERAPVTTDLANRLGTVVGFGSRYWQGLQKQYDLWHRHFPTPPARTRPRSVTYARRTEP